MYGKDISTSWTGRGRERVAEETGWRLDTVGKPMSGVGGVGRQQVREREE